MSCIINAPISMLFEMLLPVGGWHTLMREIAMNVLATRIVGEITTMYGHKAHDIMIIPRLYVRSATFEGTSNTGFPLSLSDPLEGSATL